ncbi:MAG: phosphatase PAP2 family protein, partial [Candidatus Kapabacteria bacterium]|nr:phosphatase PAP2 family protein [Candidatus Kapabacteria bacterium]
AQPCPDLPWDASITHSINGIDSPALTASSKAVSNTLLPLGIGLPSALFLGSHVLSFDNCETAPRMARAGIQMATTLAATYAVTYGLKELFGRARPFQAYPDCIRNGETPTDASFPSGHSAGSAALATSLSLAYPEWYVIAPSVGYALWTGFARMNLGVHYITDVMAGYAVGVGTALLVHVLREQVFDLAEPFMPDGCGRVSSIMVVPTTNVFSIAVSF